MHDMDEYRRCLDIIAKTNHIGGENCSKDLVVLPWQPEKPAFTATGKSMMSIATEK